MKTARFWTYLNGGWVKVSLKDGDELRWQNCQQHEEGWSAEGRTWIRYGDQVTEIMEHSGTDCDGYVSDYRSYECDVTSLAAMPPETWDDGAELPARPRWKEVRAFHRDLYAEQMGY